MLAWIENAIACVNVMSRSARLVARHARGELALDVDVRVVRDVVHHSDHAAVSERELRLVLLRHRVATVEADAEPLAAERVVAGLRPEVAARDRFVVDVQRHLAERLEVLADRLLRELDADDVLAALRRGTRETLLGRNAEEVVDEAQLAVLDEQRIAAEARALCDDYALRLLRELDLGE